MKSLNETELKKFLIELYLRYIDGEEIKDTSKKVFLDYVGAKDFMQEDLYNAILYLETIGWNLNDSKDEAKKILKILKLNKKI